MTAAQRELNLGEFRPGDELDFSHYRVVDRLGRGGMGTVYKAEDARLRRFVALKFLPGDTQRDDPRLVRFQQEAQAASTLNHPNICTIYDVGLERNRHGVPRWFDPTSPDRRASNGDRYGHITRD